MADPSNELVQYAANGGQGSGYLAHPNRDGPFPAVVVIQEWWGLNDHIKDVADRFARAGYIALAPDLYGGKATTEPDEARKLAMGLDMEHAVQEMIGAVNYLCGRADVGKIGAIGFCMGGSLTLLLAARTPRLSAAAPFYGGRPLAVEDVSRIGCPVLAIFGGQDQGIPPERITELRSQFERAGVLHEIVVYEQAGHAFFNDTRPEAYNASAAHDAWQRTLAFFAQHLRDQ